MKQKQLFLCQHQKVLLTCWLLQRQLKASQTVWLWLIEICFIILNLLKAKWPSADSQYRETDERQFLWRVWSNTITNLKVNLMRAADDWELRPAEQKGNSTQAELCETKWSWYWEALLHLCVLISVTLIFLARLRIKLGVRFSPSIMWVFIILLWAQNSGWWQFLFSFFFCFCLLYQHYIMCGGFQADGAAES